MIKTKPQSKPTSLDIFAGQPQKVGNTYGSRRAQNIGSPVVNTPVYKKPVDNFSGATKKPANLASFAPDAAYQARRIYAKGVPYKHRIHHKIENGEMPRVENKEVKRPSDDAILKFLNRVIEHIPQAGIRKAKAA